MSAQTVRQKAVCAALNALDADAMPDDVWDIPGISVDAAIPVLLAPLRIFAAELLTADDGSLVTSDHPLIGRRLNALLDQIEGGESR